MVTSSIPSTSTSAYSSLVPRLLLTAGSSTRYRGDRCEQYPAEEPCAEEVRELKFGFVNLLHAPFPKGPVIVAYDPFPLLSGFSYIRGP